MQTFLPYPSFRESARVLDPRRLNKQITEVKQLLVALRDGGAWVNHPAARMWRGYEPALWLYGFWMYNEWRQRWTRGARGGKIDHRAGDWLMDNILSLSAPPLPDWLYNDDLHASYRGLLLYKDAAWYGRFGWTDAPRAKNVWPV